MKSHEFTVVESQGLCQPEWESAYGRAENFLFLPSDEVIRFVSRYLCRRIDIHEIRELTPNAQGSRVLDVGCGLGRNMLFGERMSLEMYGNDLSQTAISKAGEWLSEELGKDMRPRLATCDIRELPWDGAYFAHAVSDSVIDSMSFEIAQAGIAEIARVLTPGGYFYCSLISGDETGRDPEFCGEVVVQGQHEHGTIQSYFNASKIRRLMEPGFEIIDLALTQNRNTTRGTHHGRWHVICRRR